ncbi:MAG TPA: ATP-binding protein [Rhodocyclaceae bacterium]
MQAPKQDHSTPPGTAQRPRILIVDDDQSNLSVLAYVLGARYEVLSAQSGTQALQLAAADLPPDLILLDVLMPEMSGYEVLAALRGSPLTADIPVIFVTGLDSVEEEEKGLELGAVDYIAKPYRPPIIRARVNTQIELKRARDRLANQNVYLEAELAKRLEENRQVQVQLLQSEKLAAIGQLAAGIVHEISTPVSYVGSNLAAMASSWRDVGELLDSYEAMEQYAPAEVQETLLALKQQVEIEFLRSDTAKLIADSRGGIGRIAEIVRDLKNFSRADSSDDRQWADLHRGLDSTLNIVWSELKYHCTLHKEYGELPKVYCNPSQINQVVLNLLVNAAQAIPDKGEISIRTGVSGDQVFIAISDTGSGIPAEVMPRLFEPFFTTKPAGKGTGLGLSIAYGIAQKHRGRIEVDSTLGKGTTFTLWLPIQPTVAAAPR